MKNDTSIKLEVTESVPDAIACLFFNWAKDNIKIDLESESHSDWYGEIVVTTAKVYAKNPSTHEYELVGEDNCSCSVDTRSYND